MALCFGSAIHVRGDWLRRGGGEPSLLLEARELVLQCLRLFLERFQVDLELGDEDIKGPDEAYGGRGIREDRTGLREERDHVDVAISAFVQEDARDTRDHSRL